MYMPFSAWRKYAALGSVSTSTLREKHTEGRRKPVRCDALDRSCNNHSVKNNNEIVLFIYFSKNGTILYVESVFPSIFAARTCLVFMIPT